MDQIKFPDPSDGSLIMPRTFAIKDIEKIYLEARREDSFLKTCSERSYCFIKDAFRELYPVVHKPKSYTDFCPHCLYMKN